MSIDKILRLKQKIKLDDTFISYQKIMVYADITTCLLYVIQTILHVEIIYI